MKRGGTHHMMAFALLLVALTFGMFFTGSDAFAETWGDHSMQEVMFERDGQRIYGRLYLPGGEGPAPTVIVGHGFNNNLSFTEHYAAALAENGFAACVFDFIGGGYGSRSDGSMTEMSVLTEAQDMSVVMSELSQRPEIDETRIGLMGMSQGGFVATYVAATHTSDVKALIAFYPAYVLQDDARQRMGENAIIPETTNIMGATIGRIYTEDALSFDIYELMPQYTGPVLILHGTADQIVPVSYSERAVQTFPNARLIQINGAGHGFRGADDEDAVKVAIQFLNEHLK